MLTRNFAEANRFGALLFGISDPYDWWKLDEAPSATSAANSGSNSGFPLDIIAGLVDFNTGGLINNAIEFTGTNGDRCYTGDNWAIGTNSFSFGGFMRADDLGQVDGRLISQTSGVSTNAHDWMLSTNTNWTARCRMRIDGSIEELESADDVLVVNTWHHIVVTYDAVAGDYKLYVDKIIVASDLTLSGNFGGTATKDVGIGNTPAAITNRCFDGLLDDFRTFGRALTQADVDEWFEVGFPAAGATAKITAVDAEVTHTEITARITAVDAETTHTEIAAKITAVDAEVTYTPRQARITAIDAETTHTEITARITAVDAETTHTEITAKITAVDAETTHTEITAKITAVDAEVTYTPRQARITAVDAEVTYTPVGATAKITAIDAETTHTEITAQITAVDAETTHTEITAKITAVDAETTHTEITAKITAVDAEVTYTPRQARITAVDAEVTYTPVGATAKITAIDAEVTHTEITARITAVDAETTHTEITARITAVDAEVTHTEITAQITAVDAEATHTEIAARITAVDAETTHTEITAQITAVDAEVTHTEITARITAIDADAAYTLTLQARITAIDAAVTYSPSVVTVPGTAIGFRRIAVIVQRAWPAAVWLLKQKVPIIIARDLTQTIHQRARAVTVRAEGNPP